MRRAAVCSAAMPHDDIEALRRVRDIPVVVLPPGYDAAQRYECVQRGAAQYIGTAGQRRTADPRGKDNMRDCLDLSDQERHPLTIITVKDLSFSWNTARWRYMCGQNPHPPPNWTGRTEPSRTGVTSATPVLPQKPFTSLSASA